MKRLIVIAAFFFSAPFAAFAVDGTFLIPSWQNPSPSASYLYSNHVVVNGTWQLPPDWAGNIYVYGDATVDGSGSLITAGTQKTDVYTSAPTVLQYYSITNPSTTASSSGTFAFDIGPQADGAHNIYIKFVGGKQCAVNTQLNAQFNTNTYTPTCAITTENAAFNLLWPARDYTVQLPPYPRMVVTPATDPALNFSNVVFGTTQTLSFFVSNTGGRTLTGSITPPPSSPFSCTPSCSYTVNPGDAPTAINITFSPLTSPTSYDQILNFSCIGQSGGQYSGCDGGADDVIAFQPRHVIGNSVVSGIQPAISVSPGSINYGTVNFGVAIPDTTITVKNIGGGILTGSVTFSTSEYSCTGPCSYSLFAGQSANILIHYVPVTLGDHDDSASFTGGTGKIVQMQSKVNDKPILSVAPSWTPINFGTLINVGSCGDKDTYIRNSGAGLLSGSVTYPPTFPAQTTDGFSCLLGCNYNNLVNDGGWTLVRFRFCPASGTPTSTTAVLTNTDNPSKGGTIPLSAQGNNVPIGAVSGTNQFNYGPTLVGSTKSASITITNTGAGGNLIGTVGSFPSSDPGAYACVGTSCSYSIPPGGTHTITIEFTPNFVQNYAGNVSVPGVGNIFMWASGVQPDFQMSYSGSPIMTCPSTQNPPDFPTCVTQVPRNLASQGNYNVGQTTFGGALAVQNKTFYLYVSNKGNGANTTYSLPNTAHFFCTSGALCSGSLAPGVNRTISYEFRPTAATSYSEPLVVTYNYSDGVGDRFVTLNLEGSSISAPYLSVSPLANIPLGNVAVCVPPAVCPAPASATFTVRNDGVGPLDYNVTIPTIGAGAPTSGLKGLWTFDNADMNWTTHKAYDSSGQGNTGTLPGPISALGKVGEALNFTNNGGVTVAKVSGLASGNTPHTISAWIKVSGSTPARQWILELGGYSSGSHHWLYNNGGANQFGVFAGAQTQPLLPVGTWVHVTDTYDGTTLKSYVNGVLAQSIVAPFNLQAVAGGVPLYLGLRDIPGHRNEDDFNGALDDVRVYNTALNASEVNQVFNNTYPQTASLVEWLKFDDATMAWNQLKAYDSSGKGNDGILSPVPVSVTGKSAQGLRFGGGMQEEIRVNSSFGIWNKNATLATWVYLSSTSAKGAFMKVGAKTNGFGIGVGNGNLNNFGNELIVIYEYSRWVPTGTAIGTGWHHVAVTIDGAGVPSVYLDGVLVGTYPGSGPSGASNISYLGGYVDDGGISRNSNATLDDMRVYDRALSATEISDLYGSGVAVGTSAFTCVSGCSFTGLLPAQSQSVVFEFVPTDAIGYIAYPRFTSTNGGGIVGYPATLPTPPSITGTGVLDPVIDVTPTSVGFPNTNQGLSSQQTITITNTGLGTLTGNISPVKTAGLNFYCKSGCNFNLSAGGSMTAILEFAPQSTGSLTGQITINSNGVNSTYLNGPAGKALVDVFGVGTFAPIIDIRGGDTNYGPVVLGKYKDRTFTIKNTGSVDLGSGNFVVTGDFSCIDPLTNAPGVCPYNITAGAEVTVTIRFKPLTVGAKSGSVSLSGVPLARFFVSGTGVSPSVKFIEQ